MLGLVERMLDDEKTIPVKERVWQSMRRILARQAVSWTHCLRESRLILDACRHDPACPSKRGDPGLPCLQSCPDREINLSARVLLASALEFAGTLRLPSWTGTGYIPPTREYFDRILAELEAMRAAKDWLAELDAARPGENGGSIATLASVLPIADQPITQTVADPAYPSPAEIADATLAPVVIDDEEEDEEEGA